MVMEARFDEPGDRFPIGMRVLAVDDDPTCLRVLETLLTRCQYHVRTTNQATKALKMLRENKFDLVISDVHMPDMDGFKLLELVGLEMDLPVIMLSANGDPKLVMKGIDHGACDYLLKPIRIEELKNIWQHVVRKKKHDPKDRDHGADGQFSENMNRKRKDQDDDDDENDENENDDPSAQKKPRVVWSVELHRKFVLAVNQLGLDKAVPKKILDLMNVEKLSRENVASHLQKYRLYLKRINNAANQQANMVAALSNTDPNYSRVASMNGIGAYRNLAASGQFPNSLYSTFPSNGMLGLAHTRNPANDHAKFPFPGNHSGSILQGMPMSLQLDQPHNNNDGISNAVDDMTIFPVTTLGSYGNGNWPNSGQSFPLGDSFQRCSNPRDKISTMTLPTTNSSGAFPSSRQMQHRRTDLQGRAETSINASAHGFDAYRPNYAGSSMSSTNSGNLTLDRSDMSFCVSMQSGQEASMQGGFVSSHFGSLEEIATAMLRQDDENELKPNGDFESGLYPPRTCKF